MKKFIYQQLLRITRYWKPRTKLTFAERIISDHLRSLDPVDAYKIRRHLLDKYLKSYPTLHSHEACRIHGFFQLIGNLRNVEGDLVECGVGRGRFLSVFAFANAYYKLGKMIYGFDSFAGFPIASEEDLGTRVRKVERISGWDNSSPELILYVLNHDEDGEGSTSILGKEDIEAIKLVPGFFSETLKHSLPEKISFLHLDADLYQSTVDVLTNCLPLMSPGGVIVFDELHENEKWPGVQKAVVELCESKGLIPKWHDILQRFVIEF